MSPSGAPTPIVLLPVGSDEVALDACLSALEAGTPAGTRVATTLERDGNLLVVTVADDGPGIDPYLRDRRWPN